MGSNLQNTLEKEASPTLSKVMTGGKNSFVGTHFEFNAELKESMDQAILMENPHCLTREILCDNYTHILDITVFLSSANYPGCGGIPHILGSFISRKEFQMKWLKRLKDGVK